VGDEERQNEEQETDGIKVVDRRLFTSDGERRQDVEEEEAPAAEEPAAEEAVAGETPAPTEEPSSAGFEHRPVEEPEGVDFTMLINAMAQPALFYLGEIPDPGSAETTVNLTQARLQIDMLELLKVKCRGNLTTQEDGLLDRVLYELRMRYVARSNQPE
jgi:hypothetical protein